MSSFSTVHIAVINAATSGSHQVAAATADTAPTSTLGLCAMIAAMAIILLGLPALALYAISIDDKTRARYYAAGLNKKYGKVG